MRQFFSILIIPFYILFQACGPSVPKESQEKETNEKESSQKLVDIHFQCSPLDQVNEATGENPLELLLWLGEETFIVDTINACSIIPPADLMEYEMPEDAITAAGGWYAGSGDYFYAKAQEKKLVIYKGWLDEAVPAEEGYHYEVFVELNLK